MEDERNIGNLSYEDFNKAYKSDLLNDPSLSYVVRQILENDCIQLERSHYWVSDADNAFKYLDEYLKYNIPDLESYELKNKFYLNGKKYNSGEEYKGTYQYFYWNEPEIKVCSFESVYGNTPYNMYTDGYPGEFHYVLKEPMKCGDILNNDVGILSIHVNPCAEDDDTMIIEKDYAKDGLFIEEDYKTGWRYKAGSIRAKIYDFKTALGRGEKDPFEGIKAEDVVIAPVPMERKRYGLMDSKKPWFIGEDDLLFTVSVVQSRKDRDNPHKFTVEYWDSNDYVGVPFGLHNEEIEGESIYDAYYKFMVKKGFFRDKANEYEDNGKRF